MNILGEVNDFEFQEKSIMYYFNDLFHDDDCSAGTYGG
jgi:hypothetical protein